MRSHFAVGTLLALGLGGTAVAAEPLSYNNIEGAYVSTEAGGLDGDGIAVSGSLEFNANTFGFASINDIDYDNTPLSSSLFNLGVGYHFPLNEKLDLVSAVSYERLRVKQSGVGSASDSGIGLGVGLRARLTSVLEGTANVKYVDLGNGVDDFTWSAGGRYYFTPNFAAGIDISDNDDGSTWSIAVRYDFGNTH